MSGAEGNEGKADSKTLRDVVVVVVVMVVVVAVVVEKVFLLIYLF